MADQTCSYCGATVPEGKGMCPSCNRLIAVGPAAAKMPESQLPPGMGKEPEAVYGRVGEQGYVPPTAHQIVTYQKRHRSVWLVAGWTALVALVVVGALVGVVYLLAN